MCICSVTPKDAQLLENMEENENENKQGPPSWVHVAEALTRN